MPPPIVSNSLKSDCQTRQRASAAQGTQRAGPEPAGVSLPGSAGAGGAHAWPGHAPPRTSRPGNRRHEGGPRACGAPRRRRLRRSWRQLAPGHLRREPASTLDAFLRRSSSGTSSHGGCQAGRRTGGGDIDEEENLRNEEGFDRSHAEVLEPFSDPDPDSEVIRLAIDQYAQCPIGGNDGAQEPSFTRLNDRAMLTWRR